MKRGNSFLTFLLACLLVLALFLSGCGSTVTKTPTNAAGTGSQSSKSQSTASNSNQGSSSNSASIPEDVAYYNGKVVSFIVPTSAGGGYDTYARLIAPYMQKYLPGSTVIVKNVPGAGQIIGTNEIFNAKPDGLTLGTINKGLIMGQIAGLEGIKFDLNKFTWLGNASTEPRVMIVRSKLPYNSIDEIKKAGYELKVATTGVGSASGNDALMLANIFGYKTKLISGYQSTQDTDMGLLRGESDAEINAYDSAKNLVNSGDAKVILVIGKDKIPEVKNAPLLSEIAPADKKSVVELMNSQAWLGRPIVATPGIPAERALALRNALKKALADPELLDKAKQAKLPITYVSAEDAADVVKTALNQQPDVVKLIKDVVQTQ